MYDATLKETLEVFTDKTSALLAFLSPTLNGAGKAATTYYA